MFNVKTRGAIQELCQDNVQKKWKTCDLNQERSDQRNINKIMNLTKHLVDTLLIRTHFSHYVRC